MAHQFALRGSWTVDLVDTASHLGAGVRTQWWGGHPHTFGPRHFLTQSQKAFDYLNAYLPLRLCSEHEFITYVEPDQAFYNFPIHTDDIPRMPDSAKIQSELESLDQAVPKNLEDYWTSQVGPTLYQKFIAQYSRKMWLVDDNTELDTFNWSPKGTALKEGPRAAWDSALSAYPHAANGYDDYFDLATVAANVYLSTIIEKFDMSKKRVFFDNRWHSYDIVVNTIAPDVLFEYDAGHLPFVGRDFHRIVLPIEHAFPDNVYFVYYAGVESFTRIVEYKKFTQHKADSTLLGLEIPSQNGKHYPLPILKYQILASTYLDRLPEGVFSIGRAGSYRYDVDIDDCILQAMDVITYLD